MTDLPHDPFSQEPQSPVDAPVGESPLEPAPFDFSAGDFPPSPPPPAPPKPVLEELKTYSESRKAAPFEPGIRNEFSLIMSGEFDPYSRDKLLLFITGNPVGLGSSELDFQIKAGRVLIPRISEFSGIRLIQELRDSGLVFKLIRPGEGDAQVGASPLEQGRFHYESESGSKADHELPVFSLGMFQPEEYQVLDSIRMVQFLRAEMLEVEKSDLFQELLERMTEALKRRARLKGAHALTALEHRLTPLRLASQYQVELSASLLKRREP